MSDVLRFDLARLADRVGHVEGRIEHLHTRFNGYDSRLKDLLALVGNVLANNGALQGEVLSALSRSEEQFVATRRAVEENSRTQGDLIRRIAELAEELAK
jgi:hypothetical protein